METKVLTSLQTTSRLPNLIPLYSVSWFSSSLRQSPVNLLCRLACPTMPAMTSSFEVLINTWTTKLVNSVNIDEPHSCPQLQADGRSGSPSPSEVRRVHIFPSSALPSAPFSFCLGFRNLGRGWLGLLGWMRMKIQKKKIFLYSFNKIHSWFSFYFHNGQIWTLL